MGCPKIAYRAESKPVLRCIWNIRNQPKQGVNCYDYGARFYDPAIGRFNTMDPWAEKYDFQSSYAYAMNNPILMQDLLDMGPDAANTTTDVAHKKNNKIRQMIHLNLKHLKIIILPMILCLLVLKRRIQV